MFHVVLVLPLLIMLGIIASILLFVVIFAALTIVVSIVGGASAALFIKNKMAKKLLILGCCIFSFASLACLLPFIALYFGLSELFLTLAAAFTLLCVALFSFLGIRTAKAIQNKIGRTTLYVLYGITGTAGALLLIALPFLRSYLLSL